MQRVEIPLNPPAEWFTPPADMPKDAGCIVEPNGRLCGYLAHWGAVLMDGTSERWTPPRSKNAYSYAHTGDTVTADGTIIKTANLGGDFGHAPRGGTDLADTQRFYENTQTQLARVRYGEDEHGVWFAGACWPNVSELDMAKLRASARSGHWCAVGDWRDVQSGRIGYELVGACLVNVPGLKYARADKAASGVLSLRPLLQPLAANHDGAMVALFLEPHVADALAVDGGEAPDQLHVTLAYFDDEAGDREDWGDVHSVVEAVSKAHLPLAGTIQGRGEFYTDDGGVVHWASPDVPGLGALREELVTALDAAGFTVRNDHGFTPHITLRYDDAAGGDPPAVQAQEINFDRLTLAVGGDMTKLATKTSIRKFERVAASGTLAILATDGEAAAAGVPVGGVLVIEGVPTSDGRFIEANATTWREVPLPLYASLENLPGHDSAALVGRIDAIERSEGGEIHYSGVVFPDAGDGAGQATLDAIQNGMLTGVSIDGAVGMDDVYYDENDVAVMTAIEIIGATLTPMPAFAGATVTLLSADTRNAQGELAMAATDTGDTTTADQTTEDEVQQDIADDNAEADALSALRDQVSALADRLEVAIGLLESAQMSARYEAATRKISA